MRQNDDLGARFGQQLRCGGVAPDARVIQQRACLRVDGGIYVDPQLHRLPAGRQVVQRQEAVAHGPG